MTRREHWQQYFDGLVEAMVRTDELLVAAVTAANDPTDENVAAYNALMDDAVSSIGEDGIERALLIRDAVQSLQA